MTLESMTPACKKSPGARVLQNSVGPAGVNCKKPAMAGAISDRIEKLMARVACMQAKTAKPPPIRW